MGYALKAKATAAAKQVKFQTARQAMHYYTFWEMRRHEAALPEEHKLHGGVSTAGIKEAIDQWRVFHEAGAKPKNTSAYALVSELMPKLQNERFPPGKPVQWTESESALWDYLEIVACFGQRHFQYANAQLTRIPLQAFSHLATVEEINLSGNKIVVIPIELVSLPNLRRLFLHHNQIRVIPDMGGCVNLETLDVRHNQLVEVPTGIGACVKLQGFDAEKNRIRAFGELVQCESLDFINLSNNLIKVVPSELTGLSKLRYMQLKHNPIVNLPPHVYIQGMAAIITYITEHSNLSDEVEASSIKSDFLTLLSSTDLTDIEITANKSDTSPTVVLPYSDETTLAKIDVDKVSSLLKLSHSSAPVHPTSVKVHSLVLLARLPILRDRISKLLNESKQAHDTGKTISPIIPTLSLSISPLELHILLKFIYADSFEAIAPPTQPEVSALAKKSTEILNVQETETLRHSLVHHWRSRLLDSLSLSKEYQLAYLGTLASKALGIVETPEAPFATSRIAQDFKDILPASTAEPSAEHEWNTDEAMKNISEGFNELSLHGQDTPIPSPANASSASPSATASFAEGHRTGIKCPAFAPNDIAFRIVNEPNAPLIGAHKSILCARSKYLHSMLTGGLIESRQTIIDMSDISYDTLKAIVEFCYTDDVSELHGEMIMELLMKARIFGLDRLLGFVESIVGYSLDISNVASITSVAYLYSLTRLAKAAKFYILSHWTQVTEDSSWAELRPEIRQKLTETATKWGILGGQEGEEQQEAQ